MCAPSAAPQQGNSAFQAGRYRQAHALYTQALELAPVAPSLQAVLYCNRAAALNAQGSHVEAIVDCCLAGQLDDSLPRVLQVRWGPRPDVQLCQICVNTHTCSCVRR
jgi:tetratricopeptide (TPR) repeat protein